MRHLESAHQQQVIEWARMASRSAKYPMLNMLHCSLNGVKLSKSQAGIAKAQGMLALLSLFVIAHKKQSSVLKIITKTD